MNLKNKLIKLISSILFLPSLCYAGDTVTVNINGSVTASTCDIQISSQTLTFEFDEVVTSVVSGFGSGIGTQETLDAKPVTFNCPSGLLLQARLSGNQYGTDDYKIQPTGTAKGFAFALNYIPDSPYDKAGSLQYSTWRNFLSAGGTDAKTVLGENVIYLKPYLIQVENAYSAGTLTGTVTINIQYTN